MSQSYEHMLAALCNRTAFVYVDVQAPRDAPVTQFIASELEPGVDASGTMRPQGRAFSRAVTIEQARALLAAGAEWKGPTHLRAEVLPES